MQARVLNKYTDTISQNDVYIGRGSKWGNPFVIGKDGDRDEVCDKYEAWFITQSDLINSIHELRDKNLVCFCSPKRCHGHSLRTFASIDNLKEQIKNLW